MMGVYAIVNTVNGKMYVGSARDIAARWRVHRFDLRGGRHHSIRLQRAWNKYGEASFEFQVMEIVKDWANLRAAEQRWIDFLLTSKGGIGYNAHSRATGGHSPGWRQPPSAILKFRDGRHRGAGNVSAKLTDDDVKAICERLVAGESTYRVARAFGVSSTTIQNIKNGHTWKHVDAPRSNSHRKGAQGARHGMAKLTDADVAEIKRRAESGDRQSDIARDFGIHQTAVSRVVSGKRWSHTA